MYFGIYHLNDCNNIFNEHKNMYRECKRLVNMVHKCLSDAHTFVVFVVIKIHKYFIYKL